MIINIGIIPRSKKLFFYYFTKEEYEYTRSKYCYRIIKIYDTFLRKKGLIHPRRLLENNYRNYSMSDIHILVTIKFYSSLGITISKIEEILTEGNITLAITSFNDRLEQLEEAFWAKTKYLLASNTYHLLEK